MSYYYATLAQIRTAINTSKTSEDAALLDYCALISERIDLELGWDVPFFLPYIDTAPPILVEDERINSRLNTFFVDGYYQSFDTVLLGTTNLVVGTDVEGYPAAPYQWLRLKNWSTNWWNACADCNDPPLAVTVTGTRAYRKRTGATWVRYGTLTAGISDSVTTITVTLDSGKALSPGSFLKVGTEFLIQQYHATDIVVERGAHGSTAAAHSLGDVVYVWTVETPITRVVARQCGLLLARRGTYDIRNSNELGTSIEYPQDQLRELLNVLQQYANL
jgi:hypothetical protein